jgi:hypothetical protein
MPSCPPPPAAPASKPTLAVVYAIRAVDFGETTGWQHLGFDIDHVDTTAASTSVCQLAAGAPVSTQVDGACGIDDSFGENLVPIVETILGPTTVADAVNAGIAAGGPTDLLIVTGAVSGPDATDVAGFFVNGLALGHTLRWDGSEAWPVDAESLQGTDISSASIAFPGAYRTGGAWTAGPSAAKGAFTFAVLGYTQRWPLTQTRVTLKASGPDEVIGVLSGIIDVQALVALLDAQYNAAQSSAAMAPSTSPDDGRVPGSDARLRRHLDGDGVPRRRASRSDRSSLHPAPRRRAGPAPTRATVGKHRRARARSAADGRSMPADAPPGPAWTYRGIRTAHGDCGRHATLGTVVDSVTFGSASIREPPAR